MDQTAKKKNKEIEEALKHLSTQWYNQDEQLYRTYLQNLYLRLRHTQKDKSAAVNTLIQKYLKAEQQLLQVAKSNNTTIQERQSFQKNINQANKEIDANEKELFALQRDSDTKSQQKQVLVSLLKIKLQNYKKIVDNFNHTINQPQNSADRDSEKKINFEVPTLDTKINQETISKVIKNVSNTFSRAEQYRLDGGLITLQAQKNTLVSEICEVIEKEALPQEMHHLYQQKEQKLKQIKATQQQIMKHSNEVETKQRNFDRTSLKNKNLQQEISRLKLRTIDELMLIDDFQQETSLNPTYQAYMPQRLEKQSQKKDNKRIVFQTQSPKNIRIALLCWAVVLALIWLIAI